MPCSSSSDDVPGCMSPLLSLFRPKTSQSSAPAPGRSSSGSSRVAGAQHQHAAASFPAPRTHGAENTSAHVNGCQHDGFGCDFGPQPGFVDADEGEPGAHEATLPAYSPSSGKADKPPFFALGKDALEIVRAELDRLSADLRTVNLDIHDHPELAFKEVRAHAALCTALEAYKDVKVQRSYIFPTAFKATFTYGKGGRTVGVNSEYDALPAIGHACGHNLIAIAGLGVFLALRKLLIETKTNGSVVLLGTPAEEGGGGKIVLLDAGAYKEMDVCLMTHPGNVVAIKGETPKTGHVGPSLAAAHIFVNFVGKTAHASAAPWEGVNALDAANIAYTSISALRQQIQPADRIHGIVVPPSDGWAANIVPDKAGMKYVVRSPTLEGLQVLLKRVERCFEAAALATGCTFSISHEAPYADLRQNVALSEEYQRVMDDALGIRITYDRGVATAGASTDAGNISHAMPFLHPSFPIPSVPNGGNHTPFFTAAARTKEAHDQALKSALGLAGVGARVLLDSSFEV